MQAKTLEEKIYHTRKVKWLTKLQRWGIARPKEFEKGYRKKTDEVMGRHRADDDTSPGEGEEQEEEGGEARNTGEEEARNTGEEKDVAQPARVNRWLLSPEMQKRDIEEAEWNAVKKSIEQREGRRSKGAVEERRRRLEEERRGAVEEENPGWRWL